MSHQLSPDDAHDENMSGITLTETPAAMSPPLPGHAQSLHSHIASLASESDEWEDEEDDDDLDEFNGDDAMRSHVRELSRRTIAQLRRAAWKGGDDDEEEEEDDEHGGFGMGGPNSFYQDNLRQRAMQDFRRSDKLLALNPYKLALSPEDVDSCLALEKACFAPDIAASREKVSLSCRPHSLVLRAAEEL
jgi:hypothetical protein